MVDEDATTAEAGTVTEPEPAREPRPRAEIVSDRYRITGALGFGGMGEVLDAHDAQLGRDVAIKRMRSSSPSERSVARFLREAKIQGRLEHPAIPPVHELGTDADGRPFFAMKKLAGTTLARLITREDPRQRLLRAFAEVCLAVEFAHTHGVIHRDLKPQNIILGEFGEVYVLDWGVAKVIGEPDGEFPRAESVEHETEIGTVIGTSGYMSPEQANAQADIDGRADVYSLGCILFEILTGETLHPPGVAGLVSALEGIDARPSKRARGRDIPPELDNLCVRAIATRDIRIPTARELGEQVQRYLDGDRDVAMRRDLAREHLDSARIAFGNAEHEDARRVAMREAGRALALDPKLAGAAELVTRLMLEPPRQTPREVESSIAADNLATIRMNAKTAMYGYLAYLAFVPAIALGGGAGWTAALFGLMAVNIALLVLHGYTRIAPNPWRLAIGNIALLAILARMFSPFLIAPGIAAVTAMLLVFSPTYVRVRQVLGVVALMTGAILGPWLAEKLGWIASTSTFEDGRVVLGAPALDVSIGLLQGVLVVYVGALIAAAALMAHAMRRSERRVRHTLHLQAWQLRQLVAS